MERLCPVFGGTCLGPLQARGLRAAIAATAPGLVLNF
jgi:hypothetical protein